jgi:hypothetical protein
MADRDRIIQITTSRDETDGSFILVALTASGALWAAIASDEADFDDWRRIDGPTTTTSARAA